MSVAELSPLNTLSLSGHHLEELCFPLAIEFVRSRVPERNALIFFFSFLFSFPFFASLFFFFS